MIADSLLDKLADEAEAEEDGIVLVNSSEEEVATMSDTSDTVSWDKSEVGRLVLDDDITYDIEADEEVAGWRAINSSSDHIFGEDFENAESYTNAGKFVLEADDTYFDIAEQV